MSVFLIALLSGKRNKMISDKVLLFLLIVYSLTIGGTFLELYNVKNSFPNPHFVHVNWLLLLLHGPLLWLYLNTLIAPAFKIKAIHLLHFTPFMFIAVIHYFDFLKLSAIEKKISLVNNAFTTSVYFYIGILAVALSTIGYNIIVLLLLRRHRQNVKNTFSSIENKDLTWLKALVIASLVIFGLNALLYNLNRYLQFTEYFTLTGIAYSFSTMYVFFIGYFGIKQGRIFVHDPGVVNMRIMYARDFGKTKHADKNGHSQIILRLHRIMDTEKPYLDKELNLAKLSRLLNISPGLLSEVLNSSLNNNFFDFINKYRVEEFKQQYPSHKNRHLSILGIAYECGFNSKAAFYRAFKKFEGKSPTTYLSAAS